MTIRSRFRAVLPLAFAATLALSACGDGDAAEFEPTQEAAADNAAEDAAEDSGTGEDADAGAEPADAAPASEAPQAAEAAQGADTAEVTGDDAPGDEGISAESAAEAGIDPSQLGEPIGVATMPAVVEGDPEATMDVALYSLERDGNTVQATFSFHVNSEDGADDPRWIYHYLGSQGWRPFLIDTVNLTRHDVMGAGQTRAMTDYSGAQFRPGTTFYAYASFAAPPEDVTTMTVHVVDGAPAITDVEIR